MKNQTLCYAAIEIINTKIYKWIKNKWIKKWINKCINQKNNWKKNCWKIRWG